MRKPPEFYSDLAALREKWGEREYSRKTHIPEVIDLLRKHRITEEALMHDCAVQTLDSIEHAEEIHDPDQPELFSYSRHVALGGDKRIARGKMNLDHTRRRKRIIDRNKRAQDGAWAKETMWLDDGLDALQDRPIGTTRDQVLAEDGTVIRIAEDVDA